MYVILGIPQRPANNNKERLVLGTLVWMNKIVNTQLLPLKLPSCGHILSPIINCAFKQRASLHGIGGVDRGCLACPQRFLGPLIVAGRQTDKLVWSSWSYFNPLCHGRYAGSPFGNLKRRLISVICKFLFIFIVRLFFWEWGKWLSDDR